MPTLQLIELRQSITESTSSKYLMLAEANDCSITSDNKSARWDENR